MTGYAGPITINKINNFEYEIINNDDDDEIILALHKMAADRSLGIYISP